jgi:hypothetical protein
MHRHGLAVSVCAHVVPVVVRAVVVVSSGDHLAAFYKDRTEGVGHRGLAEMGGMSVFAFVMLSNALLDVPWKRLQCTEKNSTETCACLRY